MWRSKSLAAKPGVPFAALIAASGVVLALMVSDAIAHPHVWVTSKSRLVYEKEKITAIEQSWTFDEFYSAMAVQGLDANNDGQYSEAELAELAKVNMEGLKEFGFFTSAKSGVSALPFAAPAKARLEHTGGVLSLHFTLPLKEPVAATDFAFATFDQTNFVAFELAKENAVTLFGAPSVCEVALRDDTPAASPAATAQNQTLAGAFAEQFGGIAVSVTKWATVDCKKS